MEFIRWGRHLGLERVPPVDERKLRAIRIVIHIEFAGVVLLILCAALMARGYGYVR